MTERTTDFWASEEATLAQWLLDQGYIAGRRITEDEVAAINTTITGQGQIVVGDYRSVHGRYTYETVAAALLSLALWEAMGWVGEPYGWHRHQPSNRRRHQGDPSQEEVRE